MSSTTILQPSLPRNRSTRPRPCPIPDTPTEPVRHRPTRIGTDTDRHRPCDTYRIGGKPHDRLDPGPWLWNAAADYRRDTRTGRHRRGELPDPPAPAAPCRCVAAVTAAATAVERRPQRTETTARPGPTGRRGRLRSALRRLRAAFGAARDRAPAPPRVLVSPGV